MNPTVSDRSSVPSAAAWLPETKRVVDGGWLAAHVPGRTPALPYIAGLGLRVEDLARTADLLSKNGIAYRGSPASLMVGPDEACGAFLEFQAGA